MATRQAREAPGGGERNRHNEARACGLGPVPTPVAPVLRLQSAIGNRASAELFRSGSTRLKAYLASPRLARPLPAAAPGRGPARPLPAGPGESVQRAVGFEFEDQTWTVFQLQPGRQFRTSEDVAGGIAEPPGSESKGKEKYKGANIFAGPAGNHINQRVGQFNLRTAPKKGALHSGKGYKIEPDGPYTDYGVSNRMDLEIVTDPFPETGSGLKALTEAFRDLADVFGRYAPHSTGDWKGDAFEASKFVGPEQHHFTRDDIYLYGGSRPTGYYKTQVTGGIRLSDLPRVMATLGASSAEPTLHSAHSSAVRMRAYGEDRPTTLAEGSSVVALQGMAAVLAGEVVDRLCTQDVLRTDMAGLADLQGFLSLVILHMAALSGTTSDGIKTHLPLLSRLPLSRLWAGVPDGVRLAIEERRYDLYRNLNPAVSTAIGSYLKQKYRSEEWASTKAVPGLKGPMLTVRLPAAAGTGEDRRVVEKALTSFTRLEWLDGLLEGRDLLTPSDLLSRLGDSDDRELSGAAEGYDKTLALFLRGHGDTKNVKEVEGQEEEVLAILENRNVTAGPMTFEEAYVFATTYFRWLVSVREGTDPLL